MVTHEFLSVDLGDFISLFGVIIGAYIANKYFQRNEKRKLTFDLLREFNGRELYSNRIDADVLISKNNNATPKLFTNINELNKLKIEGKRSLFGVMNFYKQLELLRQNNQITSSLLPALFGEIFYYWWFNCFEELSENNNNSNWEVMETIKSLFKWLSENPEVSAETKLNWIKASKTAVSYISEEK